MNYVSVILFYNYNLFCNMIWKQVLIITSV